MRYDSRMKRARQSARARRLRIAALAVFGTSLGTAGAVDPTVNDVAVHRAVLPAEQIVQILDQTVDWYRTLGAQQQTASQPSDLLILFANRQTADKVMALAFDIARANAELLSSEADLAKEQGDTSSAAHTLAQSQKTLDAQRQELQAEIDSSRRLLAAAPAKGKANLQDKLAELQGEMDMVSARRNLLDTMSEFTSANDVHGADARALKAQIEAIANSIPSLGAAAVPANGSAPAAAAAAMPVLETATVDVSTRRGIWAVAANVFKLRQKIATINAIDQRTAALQSMFTTIRTPPLEHLQALAARGDALAAQADNASGAGLRGVRDQFDTLAWLFKQTSSILIPLSKEDVLLKQYRHNLGNWRGALQGQYVDALKVLGARVGILAALLAIVFGMAELWRRVVIRYAYEPRRRFQMLLVRRAVLWGLVIAIVGSSFASELGSLVTFAGLITAGLAVAMQSILVSVVGYFILIGKYGLRVGDRVQIGNVTGEVIELGLVRMQLMELNDHGLLGPTGRVVAFANSIVFQSSSGLFKQIPGVNIAWHETTMKLPSGCDSAAVKTKILEAVAKVINEYRVEIDRQTREIQKNTASESAADAHPQVQLKFSVDGVEALVRYPVHLQHAAEIDERVARELLRVVSEVSKP